MRLRVGEVFRAEGRDRAAYRVTGVVSETPRFGLYEGRKLLTNYHFGRRSLEEAGDEEGLDVWLKSIEYETKGDRDHIKVRREMLKFEAGGVLGRSRRKRGAEAVGEVVAGRPLSNLLPEPLDYLRVVNDRDEFALDNVRQLMQSEPILVTERVRGEPLTRRPDDGARVAADLFDFLATMHFEGLLLNGLCPEAVLCSHGRLHYVASEMVIPSEGKRAAARPKLYPPNWYTPGYTAPEAFEAGEVGPRADLFAWAATTYFLLTGESAAEIAARQGGRSARFGEEHFAKVKASPLAPALRACLAYEAGKRPASCSEVPAFSLPGPKPAPVAEPPKAPAPKPKDKPPAKGKPGDALTELWRKALDEGQREAMWLLIAMFSQLHGPKAQEAFEKAAEQQMRKRHPDGGLGLQAEVARLTRWLKEGPDVRGEPEGPAVPPVPWLGCGILLLLVSLAAAGIWALLR